MPGAYTEPESRARPPTTRGATRPCCRRTPAARPRPSYGYQVELPQRPEPGLRPGPRRSPGRRPRRRCSNRQGIPEQELGACVRCNLQIEGSGPKPTDVILDAGTDYSGQRGPSAKPGRLRQARRAARRPRRRLRGPQLPHARRARVRLLHRGDRRHPARQDEVLLERRLRPPELHHRPPRGQNCDGFGAGDAALYPGAAPETGAQATGVLPRRAAGEHRRQAVRHARLGARLLGLDGQRRPHHQQPHLRQRRRHRQRHAVVGRPPRLPRRQLRDRQQLHLLEQLQHLPARTRP